jgi:hypothetical protein
MAIDKVPWYRSQSVTTVLLVGLIGTGGCGVMLSTIHLCMEFPARLAVGTTPGEEAEIPRGEAMQ